MIKAYMTSLEFQELMTTHDEGLYPTLFFVGQNLGIRTIRENFPKVDPIDFEPPSDPVIMESAEDQEMEHGESEGETEEEGDEGNREWILDPNVTLLNLIQLQFIEQ